MGAGSSQEQCHLSSLPSALKRKTHTNVKRYMRLDVHADCNSLILVRNFVLRALWSLDGSAIGMLADLRGLSSVPSTRIWWVTLLVIQAP